MRASSGAPGVVAPVRTTIVAKRLTSISKSDQPSRARVVSWTLRVHSVIRPSSSASSAAVGVRSTGISSRRTCTPSLMIASTFRPAVVTPAPFVYVVVSITSMQVCMAAFVRVSSHRDSWLLSSARESVGSVSLHSLIMLRRSVFISFPIAVAKTSSVRESAILRRRVALRWFTSVISVSMMLRSRIAFCVRRRVLLPLLIVAAPAMVSSSSWRDSSSSPSSSPSSSASSSASSSTSSSAAWATSSDMSVPSTYIHGHLRSLSGVPSSASLCARSICSK